MEKFCKSCGMPMDIPEDFANNNVHSDYCLYCGDKEDKTKKQEKPEYLKKEEYYKKKEVKSKKKKVKKKPTVKKKSSKKR